MVWQPGDILIRIRFLDSNHLYDPVYLNIEIVYCDRIQEIVTQNLVFDLLTCGAVALFLSPSNLVSLLSKLQTQKKVLSGTPLSTL